MKKLELKDIVHTNQKLLVQELQKRRIDVHSIDSSIELIKAVYKNHEEYILDRFSSLTPHSQVEITADKYLAKKIMHNNGISVTKGEVFNGEEISKALEYISKELSFPIVFKPNWGSHGDEIIMNISSLLEFKEVVNSFCKKFGEKSSFLIEEQFNGKEYRVFIAKTGNYAVLHRDPAYVVGNGIKNILQLIEDENIKREESYSSVCLCPIIIDSQVIPNVHIIPKKGEKIYVRTNSNLAKGGYSIDMTDSIHSSIISIAKKVLNSFPGLPYAGIDILSTNSTFKQNQETYKVLEVNSNPGLSMHMFPGTGKPRNIAKIIVDIIFPETI